MTQPLNLIVEEFDIYLLIFQTFSYDVIVAEQEAKKKAEQQRLASVADAAKAAA